MQIEGQRVTMLQNSQEQSRQQMAAWRGLNDKFTSFQSLLDGYKDTEDFLSKAVSSSNSDILTATATTGAVTGNYSIEVDQLATSSRMIHGGFADINSTAVNTSGGAQNFVYTYGTGGDMQTITLSVPDGTTLASLKDLINRDSNNPGVKATLINDGSGSATAYHLVMSSTNTGTGSVLAMDDADVVTHLALDADVSHQSVAGFGIKSRQIAGVGIAVGVAVPDIEQQHEVVAVGERRHWLGSSVPAVSRLRKNSPRWW